MSIQTGGQWQEQLLTGQASQGRAAHLLLAWLQGQGDSATQAAYLLHHEHKEVLLGHVDRRDGLGFVQDLAREDEDLPVFLMLILLLNEALEIAHLRVSVIPGRAVTVMPASASISSFSSLSVRTLIFTIAHARTERIGHFFGGSTAPGQPPARHP